MQKWENSLKSDRVNQLESKADEATEMRKGCIDSGANSPRILFTENALFRYFVLFNFFLEYMTDLL